MLSAASKVTRSTVSSVSKKANLSTGIAAAPRLEGFGGNIWTELTPLVVAAKAVNLGQGFPTFPAPDLVKEAAKDAIDRDLNQYTRSQGHPRLVRALASTFGAAMGREIDANNEVITTVGATEGLFAVCQAFLGPGDEAVVLEPFYDCYVSQITMAGGTPVYVPLTPMEVDGKSPNSSDWSFDREALTAAVGPKTKMLLLNNPHNPTGKMFTTEELAFIADLAVKHDFLVVSDEVYSSLVYDNASHHHIASLPGMWERTLTLGSAGKTFSVTGWKVGWAIGSEDLCKTLWHAHQWIPFCVAAPLQEAVAASLEQAAKNSYYPDTVAMFDAKRSTVINGLKSAGLEVHVPEASYFVLADVGHLSRVLPPKWDSERCDMNFTKFLISEVGVCSIPLGNFYSPPHRHLASKFARFAFCKADSELEAAIERLQSLSEIVAKHQDDSAPAYWDDHQ